MYKTISRRLKYDQTKMAFWGRGESSKRSKPKAPKRLIQAAKEKIFVPGRFSRKVSKGFIVIISGFECFCPMSEMYPRIIDELKFEKLRKKPHDFIILKASGTSVIVSRRRVLAIEGLKIARRSFEKGIILNGEIVNFQKYGMFIDIGGVDGLLHISEYPSHWLGKPPHTFKLGSKIDVIVKSILGNDRIALKLDPCVIDL